MLTLLFLFFFLNYFGDASWKARWSFLLAYKIYKNLWRK
jgi:hypothetical protein